MIKTIINKEVSYYLEKQSSPQKEICLELRKIILKLYPKMKEEMKWGAIVYDDGRYYIGVVKYGVNLGFAVGGLDKEEIKQFEGNGKTMRHIKIKTLSDINKSKLTRLIKMVHDKAVCKPC
jgi:hypothetical protein